MDFFVAHPWLFFVAGFIPFVSLYFILRNLDQKRQAAIAEGAAQHGWEANFSQRPPVVFKLRGTTQEIPWELVAIRARGTSSKAGSSTSSASTKWMTEAVKLPGKIILVAPMPKGASFPKFAAQGFIGSFVVPLVLKMFLGPDAGDLTGVVPVEAGPSYFRENFIVLSNDAAHAQAFFQGKAANVLLQWNEQPDERLKAGIVLWQKGLQIRFGEVIRDFQLLDLIVNFGAQFAKALKGESF